MPLLVIVTHITNGGKVSAKLHKGAGDGSNSQLILKWHRYYIFSIIHRPNNFKMNLVVTEALITHVTYRGKARAMLPMDPFGKRHKLVHNGRFQNFEVLLFKIL